MDSVCTAMGFCTKKLQIFIEFTSFSVESLASIPGICTVRAKGSVVEHSDLGVQVHSSNAVTQVDRVVKILYGSLAFIGEGIVQRSWNVILQLYKSLVRVHLHYCVQLWPP